MRMPGLGLFNTLKHYVMGRGRATPPAWCFMTEPCCG